MTQVHSSIIAGSAGSAGSARSARRARRARGGCTVNFASASLLLVALAATPAVHAADRLLLSGGEFAIFYPHDGHMPSIAAASPSTVSKVVLKVAV